MCVIYDKVGTVLGTGIAKNRSNRQKDKELLKRYGILLTAAFRLRVPKSSGIIKLSKLLLLYSNQLPESFRRALLYSNVIPRVSFVNKLNFNKFNKNSDDDASASLSFQASPGKIEKSDGEKKTNNSPRIKNSHQVQIKDTFKDYNDGIIPFSFISFDDPVLQKVLARFDATYLESSWGHVHKIPFPDILAHSIRINKGLVLPDGSYCVGGFPVLEFEIKKGTLSKINEIISNTYDGIELRGMCIGLYKIIIEGLVTRQILVVVDQVSKLPQVSISLNEEGDTKVRISDELAKTLDGVEIMSYYYDNNGQKHYIRLGSIINGDKVLGNAGLLLVERKGESWTI